MELLYLCLFLLQISFSLSSLSTFNTVDTNMKTLRISNTFITCLRNSTIPDEFLKQIESMNTIPMTILDDSLLSHSFDQKEIINIRATIDNCTFYVDNEEYANKNVLDCCSPSILTNCLLPYIDFENDKND